MKKPIPFFTMLACTLTACGDKETEEIEDTDLDTDTEDTDTEDTDTDDTDISLLIGAWNLETMIETYNGEIYETSFPQVESYIYDYYGFRFVDEHSWHFALDIGSDGSAAMMVIETYVKISEIEQTEIYYSIVGYTYIVDSGLIEREGDEYSLILEEEESLSCTLSEEIFHCQNEISDYTFSYSGEIPDGTAVVVESWPQTPDYTKEDCVDAEIESTGYALEWGGFDGVGNDTPFACQYQDYASPDGYSIAEDKDDLVFSFEAPYDGCFAVNTIGTSFSHGIQILQGCDDTEYLSCSMTGYAEILLEEGQEVLVQLDGAGGENQAFNISINETDVDRDFEEFPENTENIDTYYWMEEHSTICGYIGYGKTFLWTAPSSGQLTIDTTGSDFDTVLRVEEAICGGGEHAICNDNGSETGYASLLQREVAEGHEYKITIGGLYWDFGSLSVSLEVQ